MDINTFVVDKIRKGVGFSRTDSSMIFCMTEVKEPSLKSAADKKECIGADGSPIMSLFNAKTAEISGSNAILDFGLLAAQYGTTKTVAAAGSTITMPAFEEFVTTASQTTVVLENTPVGTEDEEIPFIYAVTGGGVATKYTLGQAASATAFTLDTAIKTITLPTSLAVGTKIFVPYDYAASAGVSIVNKATKFPRACKFVLDVMGHDVCNKDLIYNAKIVFYNAQLSPEVELTLKAEGEHPFTITANQEYCDSEKKLFEILIPESVEED